MSTHSTDYSAMTTKDLEYAVSDPSLSPAEKAMISEVLAERIQKELLHAAGEPFQPDTSKPISGKKPEKRSKVKGDTHPDDDKTVQSSITPPPGYALEQNTSGRGRSTIVPSEMRGWNWGAFLLGPFWSIGNRTWIGLLTFVPYVGFVMMFVLGAKGNEWAWRNRHWDNIEQFRSAQKSWAKWGLALLIFGVVGFLIASGGF